MTTISTQSTVRLHLTNVAGAGASQLLLSLLPALEADTRITVQRIDLPDRGELAAYRSNCANTVTKVYLRHLPNALSRILECTLLAGEFDGDTPLLVLGDLPLRCHSPQTVFVQQANLLTLGRFRWQFTWFKYALARAIFRINITRVRSFIVQTDVMRDALELCYPSAVGKVHVIAQPVPSWLLHSGLKREARLRTPGQALNLIYPAAGYPHKNHALLARLDSRSSWPVEQLVLTLDAAVNPAPSLTWVQCRGFMSPQAMIAAYSRVDALLFLSKEESYGFPLVEAMFVGLPIVCPDLPYAHTLCGGQAFYFDPDQPESLRHALASLKSQLDQGWWPNWKSRLTRLPKNWEDVARKFLEITCNVYN
jgi:glycosyltransferase involved in cell wall biosynthesis